MVWIQRGAADARRPYYRHGLQRGLAVVLVVFGFSIGVSTPSSAVDAEGSRYYEDALVRFERNEFPAAVIQLKNALKSDPNMLAAHVLLGKALLRTGDPGAAEVSFDQALKLGVNRAEVIVPLSQALAAQGKFDALLDRVSPAGLPRPLQVDVLIARGNAQVMKGNLTAAQRTYEEARVLDPNSASVRLAQAKLLLQQGDTSRASALVEEALKIAPDAGSGWNLRASLAHLKGDVRGALTGYEKAIALNLSDVDARVAQVGLLIDLGRLQEAQRGIDELQSISPREPRAAYLRAVIAGRNNDAEAVRTALVDVVTLVDGAPKGLVAQYPQLLLVGGLSHFGLGNHEKAKEYLVLFLAQNPGHPGATKVVASLYIDAGDTTRAIAMLESVRKAAPNDPQILSLLAAAYMLDRRYTLAAGVLEQAVTISGGAADVRADYGVSLLGLGQGELGLAQLQQAFSKDPGQARAGVALAGLYLKHDQPKKAIEVIDAVVRREPDNVAVVNMQGVVHAAAGDRGGARAAYERVLSLNSRFHAARLNLARLDLAEGKPDVARERLNELLKGDPRNGEAMFEFALLEEQAGNGAETVRWLEKAMTVPRQAAHAGARLTDVFLRQRDVGRALTVSRQTLTIAPKDLSVLFARSRALIAAGDSGTARLTLKDASALAAFNPGPNLELARLQLAARDRDGALYSLDRILKAQPGYLPALVLLTELELGNGEYSKAEPRIRNINERFPTKGAGERLMGDLVVARGQVNAAIPHYRAALAKDKDAAAAIRLYRAHLLAGDAPKGLAFLEHWFRDNPGESAVLRTLADGYLRTGNLAAARTSYDRLLERRRDDAAVLNNLAQVALRQGDKSALDYAENALRVAPADPGVIDTVGWVLVQQGQLDRGVGVLRDARLRDPNSLEIRYHLAAALAQAGREAEARILLKEILAIGVAFDQMDDARKLQRQLGP
ncbi:MAG: XrtA/PEP-CTERM system TPR-repeat protein PrsT [Betaproteobacteria bacterium]